MADEDEESTALEKLQQRHRKEKKELQAKIQALKHGVPKGDKKRKKDMMAEVARLENELCQRHQKEEEDYKNHSSTNDNTVAKDEAQICSKTEGLEIGDDKQPKISKAQKRKEKKEAEERERQKRIAEAELENASSARNIENEKFSQILKMKGLCVKEIAPDGNCLYNAVADQLNSQMNIKVTYNYSELRKMTAEYMRAHQEEFLPFLVHADSGNLYTPDEYEIYCNDLVTTAVWGGQLEISALSQVLKRRIEIYQAEAPLMIIGEENSDLQPVSLSYHLHAYGLGEHYNSVIPASEENEEEF